MNELIIQNGFIADNDSQVAGSLSVSGDVAVTGSISVSGSIQSQDVLYTHDISGSYTAGQKFVWQSPHGDWRTYIVKSGQTLAPGETPYTNAEKLDRIDGKTILTQEAFITHTSTPQSYLVFCQTTPNKYFMAHYNTTSTVIRAVSFNTSSRVFSDLSVSIALTTSVLDMIYVPSLDEVWALQGNPSNLLVVRIDNATNTVTGSITPLSEPAIGGVASYQLYLDELRGYVYAAYSNAANNWFRLDRIDIATQAVTGSAIQLNATSIRTGELNVATGILYLGDQVGRYNRINVDTWTNQGTVTDGTNLASPVNISLINDNRMIVHNAVLNMSVYDISNPAVTPVHIKNIPETVKSHYSVYVPELHKIITHSQGINNNNFRAMLYVINPDTLEVEDKLDIISNNVLLNNSTPGGIYWTNFIINPALKQIVTSVGININSASHLISFTY